MLRSYAAAFAEDIRFGLRMMGRTLPVTAAALVMIALGTGANAAMFSVVDAVMLRSPFADPDRLAIVRVNAPGHGTTAAVSLEQYRALAESAPAFEAIAALGGGRPPVLTGLGEPRRINVECVTAGMFPLLGVAPLAGRTFTSDEDRPGGPSVVVLSYDFWQRELGGRADAVGRVMTLNGVPTTVVGVMPRRFLGPVSRNGNDGWLPLGAGLGAPSPTGCSPRSSVNVFARVSKELTLSAAAAHATASAGIGAVPDFEGKTGATLSLIPLDEQTFSELRTPFLALVGAVVFVLLIASANVANLQLERVFSRRRELAVRLALGAGRGRIVRQALTENLLLYVIGAAAGMLVAEWTLHLLVSLLPAYIPHVAEIEVNGRILGATIAVACVTGLLVGLIPAVQASSSALIDDLKDSSRTSTPSGQWIRRALVVGQLALSVTLLVGATLMIRTFLTLRPSDPGFVASHKVTTSVRLQGKASAGAAPLAFFSAVFEGLNSVPGILGVTGSTYLPMSGNVAVAAVDIGGETLNVWTGSVMPNYFTEMGIPLLRGRPFNAGDDRGGTPVAIINETMARRGWSSRNPLGTTVTIAASGRPRIVAQIVGVLRDTRSLGVDTKSRPELYVPFAQNPTPFLNVIIRTADASDPRVPAAVRGAIASVDPAQVVDRFTSLEEMLDSRVATPRFGAWMLGLFAATALLLAAVGLAASVGRWITQRTREIGVRMALGADAARVTRIVVGQGLTMTAAGLALGLAGAAASTRLLAGWLYGVTALDPPTFIGSAAAMLAIAAFACYLPARRATRIDPLAALRSE